MKNVPAKAILLILMMSSCAKPLISNLEKGTYGYQTAPPNIVKVSVSILPLVKVAAEPDKPKTFLDLRDSLPHIFLKVIATKTDDPDKLIELLSKTLSAPEKKVAEKKSTDFTQYKVRFAYSNIKTYYNDSRFMHPNTRLEFLTTKLKMPADANITFYNIDRLENEFEDIDFGNLSRDQTVTFNAKLSATGALGTSYASNNSDKNSTGNNHQNGKTRTVYDADGNVVGTVNNAGTLTSANETTSGNTASADAKVSATAEAGYLNTESIKEAIAVKLKRLKTGFNFSDKELTIAQRGRPLGDISDNIYVTATLKISNPTNVFSLDVYSFDNLFDENNQMVAASKLVFSKRNVNFVPCDSAKDVILKTKYEGAVRVAGNQSSSPGVNALEYDDRVTYYKIDSADGQPLKIDKNLFCKNAYKFTGKDANGDDYVLKIAAPTVDELDVFIDDKPELLLQWLINNLANPTIARLRTSKLTLYFENIRTHAKVYIVKSHFTAAELLNIGTLAGIKAEKRLP